MYGTTNGEIPLVGKVDLTWVQTPLPPVTLPPTTNPSKNGDDDTQMEEGDAMSTSSPAHGAGGNHAKEEHQENIDYDIADENDWGPQ